jgi:serine protease Do
MGLLHLVAAMGALHAQSTFAQTNAEFAFFRASPSIVIVTTDHGNQGSAVAYFDFAETGTGLLTSCHTLVGATSIRASRKGVTTEALFIAGDQETDHCIPGVQWRLPVAEPRTFLDLRVGEPVFAIGAPRGLALSITNGTISQIRGDIFFSPPILIQTTAPISPGSSGGGLFDADGRLIGISSFMSKDSQALNFALSVNMARSLSSRASARRLSDLRAVPKGRLPARTQRLRFPWSNT